MSGVAGHMGAAPPFSVPNCSDIINHHGSFLGIGSGDFPPLCPSVKGVSGNQKGVSKVVTPPGEASARHYAPTKLVCNAISGASFPDVQGDASLARSLRYPSRSVRFQVLVKRS